MNRALRKRSLTAMLAIMATAMIGCRDNILDATPDATVSTGTTPPSNSGSPSALPYTITGTLEVNPSFTIPANARLVVMWRVSATSPDYEIMYGQGAIDPANNTFSITFNGPLQDAALNLSDDRTNGVGVGYILLTDDPTLQEGVRMNGNSDRVLGSVDNTCIIYTKGDPKTWGYNASSPRTWLEGSCAGQWLPAFNSGFNMGRGTTINCRFDGFAPASQNGLKLIVDPQFDFHFPNWT
ncbi:MAG: hypothetical protein IT211_04190 [Armatimonadetes bacterium]|nr:hypothetical protein [Armatimonadota bacterium]